MSWRCNAFLAWSDDASWELCMTRSLFRGKVSYVDSRMGNTWVHQVVMLVCFSWKKNVTGFSELNNKMKQFICNMLGSPSESTDRLNDKTEIVWRHAQTTRLIPVKFLAIFTLRNDRAVTCESDVLSSNRLSRFTSDVFCPITQSSSEMNLDACEIDTF